MEKQKQQDLMEKIVSLCKRRGFVFPGSEIYGGFAGTYDYGHYGVLLRKNVIETWQQVMRDHDNIAFIESSIFTAPRVWEASGHTTGFSDPLVSCKKCRTNHRADHLLEAVGGKADEKKSEAQKNKIFYESGENVSGSFMDDHINIKNDTINSYKVKVIAIDELLKSE